MFKLGLTSDAPGAKWCKVRLIEDELYNWEKEIFPKYNNKFNFQMWICFRCLPKEYKRKSMRRFYDEDNALSIDISIDEEILRHIKNGKYYPLSEEEQRKIMGTMFFSFLTETMKKYKNKLSGIKEYGDEFLFDTNKWLTNNNWV